MVNKGNFELSNDIEDKLQKKKITAIFIFALFLLIIILSFVWIKYEVEGAKGLPFEIEEILVVSTADGNRIENKDKKKKDRLEVSQVNDVFIKIKEKDNNFTNIKQITIGNFELIKPKKGEVAILEPSGDIPELFSKSKKNFIEEEIEYKGAKVDNLEQLETSGKGGTIAFRIENKLGSYRIAKDEIVKYDSSLLNKFVKEIDELKFNLSFDLVIELENGFKFITNIELEKPVEEILKENRSVLLEDIENISFRKI